MKLSDQIFFTQRLSLLLGSGISILDAFSILSRVDKNNRSFYEIILENLRKGNTLSKSIKNENIKFDNYLLILIKNGENTGNLAQTLMLSSDFLSKRSEIKSKLITILMYPLFIVISTSIMALFLILYIFSKIIPMLMSMNIELPLITRIVLKIYNIFTNYGLIISIFISLIFLIVFILYKRNSKVQDSVFKLMLSTPILGKLFIMNHAVNFCSTGEILLNSGKGVSDIISVNIDNSNNITYINVYKNIYADLQRGVSLSMSIKNNLKYFPETMYHMCEIGERTGQLSKMLNNCREIFEKEIDNFLKRFTASIEPVLMLSMGVTIGTIALSIILPIYAITNHIGK